MFIYIYIYVFFCYGIYFLGCVGFFIVFLLCFLSCFFCMLFLFFLCSIVFLVSLWVFYSLSIQHDTCVEVPVQVIVYGIAAYTPLIISSFQEQCFSNTRRSHLTLAHSLGGKLPQTTLHTPGKSRLRKSGKNRRNEFVSSGA